LKRVVAECSRGAADAKRKLAAGGLPAMAIKVK